MGDPFIHNPIIATGIIFDMMGAPTGLKLESTGGILDFVSKGKFKRGINWAESTVTITCHPRATGGVCNSIGSKIRGANYKSGAGFSLSMDNFPRGKYKLKLALSQHLTSNFTPTGSVSGSFGTLPDHQVLFPAVQASKSPGQESDIKQSKVVEVDVTVTSGETYVVVWNPTIAGGGKSTGSGTAIGKITVLSYVGPDGRVVKLATE